MKKKFITIGNERIKASNIKNYGISEESRLVIIKETRNYIKGKLTIIEEILYEAPSMITGDDYNLIEQFEVRNSLLKEKPSLSFNGLSKNLESSKIYRYLYITTFTKDNYIFYEYDYNIDQLLEELDEQL